MVAALFTMYSQSLTLGSEHPPGSVKDKLKEKPKQKDFLRIKLKKKKKKKKAKSGKKSVALGPFCCSACAHSL